MPLSASWRMGRLQKLSESEDLPMQKLIIQRFRVKKRRVGDIYNFPIPQKSVKRVKDN